MHLCKIAPDVEVLGTFYVPLLTAFSRWYSPQSHSLLWIRNLALYYLYDFKRNDKNISPEYWRWMSYIVDVQINKNECLAIRYYLRAESNIFLSICEGLLNMSQVKFCVSIFYELKFQDSSLFNYIFIIPDLGVYMFNDQDYGD